MLVAGVAGGEEVVGWDVRALGAGMEADVCAGCAKTGISVGRFLTRACKTMTGDSEA